MPGPAGAYAWNQAMARVRLDHTDSDWFGWLFLQNGDEFMNRIQDLAAYVPYMTCPGNHG